MKSYHAETEQELQDVRNEMTVLASKGSEGGEWKTRYDDLQRETQYMRMDNDELRKELEEQQRVTEEVRQEASIFLEEMKAISDRSDESWAQEQKLVQQVRKLEDELQEWKDRYSRVKAQIRNDRAASMSLAIPLPDAGKDGGLIQPNGLVKDIHISRFQLAIDETLRVARVNPAAVSDHMKAVVSTVKHICEDVPETASPDDTTGQKYAKLRGKVSATANNFITASKNFALAKGLSPVSLLDAAASHLSTAVVELVQVVKLRPTSPDELGEDAIAPLKSDKYFSMNGRSSVTESVYSTVTGTQPRSSQLPNRDRVPSTNGAPNGFPNGKPVSINDPSRPSLNEPSRPSLSDREREDQLDNLNV